MSWRIKFASCLHDENLRGTWKEIFVLNWVGPRPIALNKAPQAGEDLRDPKGQRRGEEADESSCHQASMGSRQAGIMSPTRSTVLKAKQSGQPRGRALVANRNDHIKCNTTTSEAEEIVVAPRNPIGRGYKRKEG